MISSSDISVGVKTFVVTGCAFVISGSDASVGMNTCNDWLCVCV